MLCRKPRAIPAALLNVRCRRGFGTRAHLIGTLRHIWRWHILNMSDRRNLRRLRGLGERCVHFEEVRVGRCGPMAHSFEVFVVASLIVSPQKRLADHSFSFPVTGAQTKQSVLCFKVEEGLTKFGWEILLDEFFGPGLGAMHSGAGVRVDKGNKLPHDNSRGGPYESERLHGNWFAGVVAEGESHFWSRLVRFSDDNMPQRVIEAVIEFPKHGHRNNIWTNERRLYA